MIGSYYFFIHEHIFSYLIKKYEFFLFVSPLKIVQLITKSGHIIGKGIKEHMFHVHHGI